jgi:peptidoglycan/xylan/chitin deacetylase (PgdA/CDA1 family)
MYHEVNRKDTFPELVKYINMKYIVDSDSFEAQLYYLRTSGYQTINISELEGVMAKKNLALTFDDGYLGNYTYAFRLLKKLNFKATFFITTDWVGLPNMLNWEQIEEMSNYGMEIGSHTCSHTLLAIENENKIKEELKKSKDFIEQKIKREVRSVSYPSGSFNRLVNRIAAEGGYKSACVSDYGYWNNKTGFIIPRISAVNDLNLFKKILKHDKGIMLKEGISANSRKVLRSLLGRERYNRMYMKFFNLDYIKK